MAAIQNRVLGTGWTFHVPEDETVRQMARFLGPAGPLDELQRLLEGDPREPLLHVDLLERTRNSIRAVFAWRRPRPGDPPGAETLFAHLAWSRMLATVSLRDGIVVRALHEECDELQTWFDDFRARFGEAFDVSLIRAGELDAAFSPGADPLDDAQTTVLRHAVTHGYYEEPRRCGVRELADSLEMSKSAAARRLREIERIAITRIQSDRPLFRPAGVDLDPVELPPAVSNSGPE